MVTQARTTLQGPEAIAAFLGLPNLHRTTVVRWVQEEGLPAFSLAGRWYCDPDDLDAWWRRAKARLQGSRGPGTLGRP